MKNRWIFKDFSTDFAALWAVGFPLILLLMFSPHERAWGLLALIGYVFIDSGHAYVTALRTYFQKNILLSNPRFILVPTLCFLVFFLWAYFGQPYLWSFVIYATFYHNTRQHYGILKWYEKLNSPIPKSSFFLYFFTVMPFIGFHFKDFKYSGIYHLGEFFFYPQPILFSLFLTLNSIGLLWFLWTYAQKIWQNAPEKPAVFAILFPALINFTCFYLGNSLDQVLLPMVAVHGIAYYFLTAKVLKTNEAKSRHFGIYMLVIVLVSCGFGFMEYFTSANFAEVTSPEHYKGRLNMSLIISLIVVPSITHYILDGMIWRKTDPEFKRTLSSYTQDRRSST